MKVGGRLQHTKAGFRSYYNNSRMHFNFANGIPTQLTMFADQPLTTTSSTTSRSSSHRISGRRDVSRCRPGCASSTSAASTPKRASSRTCSFRRNWCSRRRMLASARRTSTRGWVLPTICSATERRHSSSASADIRRRRMRTELRPLAAAFLPRRDDDQSLVERPAVSGWRSATGQFLPRLRPVEHGRER